MGSGAEDIESEGALGENGNRYYRACKGEMKILTYRWAVDLYDSVKEKPMGHRRQLEE